MTEIVYWVGPAVDPIARELLEMGRPRIAWGRFVGPQGEDIRIVTRAGELPLGPHGVHGARVRLHKAARYETGEGAMSLEAWMKEMEDFEAFVAAGEGEWVA